VKAAERVIGHKAFALAVIVGVGVWFLVVPALAGRLGGNPLERLLHTTGEIAIWTLGAVLSLTPLRVLFPKSRIVNALNRHRRYIGVSSCIYALLHFTCHILYQGSVDDLLASFSKGFIWFGFTGLAILVILALTSNNWMVRKLGAKNWKRLHRLAYPAAVILIYHQSIAGKGHWYIARWLLFPLLGLQLARIAKTYLFKSPLPAAATRRAGSRSS
jgi:sulfoxide reductase heme-binding subunit YedZ